MTRTLQGALAGALATFPMTVAMVSLYRGLPRSGRHPLPPVQITAEFARRAGARRRLAGRRLVAAALAAHFGYGAATGALYPLILGRARAESRLAGVAYGVGIWTLSYLGWIPALRVLEPATEHPPQRNALMIFAHIVWGAALAQTLRRLRG